MMGPLPVELVPDLRPPPVWDTPESGIMPKMTAPKTNANNSTVNLPIMMIRDLRLVVLGSIHIIRPETICLNEATIQRIE